MGFMEMIGDKIWILIVIGVFLVIFAAISEFAKRIQKRKGLETQSSETVQKEKEADSDSLKAA
jgi:hypothetical protein